MLNKVFEKIAYMSGAHNCFTYYQQINLNTKESSQVFKKQWDNAFKVY